MAEKSKEYKVLEKRAGVLSKLLWVAIGIEGACLVLLLLLPNNAILDMFWYTCFGYFLLVAFFSFRVQHKRFKEILRPKSEEDEKWDKMLKESWKKRDQI